MWSEWEYVAKSQQKPADLPKWQFGAYKSMFNVATFNIPCKSHNPSFYLLDVMNIQVYLWFFRENFFLYRGEIFPLWLDFEFEFLLRQNPKEKSESFWQLIFHEASTETALNNSNYVMLWSLDPTTVEGKWGDEYKFHKT